MEIKLCRICGKQNENFIHIFTTEGLKNKIETCLPIIVTHDCPLPDTICAECLDSVDNFYSFIKSCLQNIIVLEAQYEIIESCLKTKRKVDRSVSVDPCDLVRPTLIKSETLDVDDCVKNEEIVNNLKVTSASLVDYDFSSSNDSETDDDDEEKTIPTENVKSDIITEIVQRKCLKRKNNEDILPCVLPPTKLPKHEFPTNQSSSTMHFSSDSSSRRKNSRPKRVEYHLESKVTQYSDHLNYKNEYIQENDEFNMNRNVFQPQQEQQQQQQLTMQMCLLCEQQLPGLLAFAGHMYETHAIDLSHIYPTMMNPCDGVLLPPPPPPPPPPPAPLLHQTPQQQSSKNRKIPELVKISDVLNNKRINNNNRNYQEQQQQQQQFFDKPTEIVDVTVTKQQQQLFVCNECPVATTTTSATTATTTTTTNRQRSFKSFAEFSTHRRAQHQIFHCDLCPKFYGRNSHLWKHVNRVHKGHVAITCQECGKTSASEYHLAQHRNKMHSSIAATVTTQQQQQQQQQKRKYQQQQHIRAKAQPAAQKHRNRNTNDKKDRESLLKSTFNDESDDNQNVADEDDLLTQKFQGFDFKSVRQSFLKQELISKQQQQQQQQRFVSVLKTNLHLNTIKNDVEFDDDDVTTANDEDDADNKKTPTTAASTNIPAPKEIDSSSDLYTTIITNYSPPTNEGPYKCPKCFKGFHKKNLLKKHKKNCRPRLQKDLLTRCKTCSRIFKDRQSLTKHLVNYHSEYTCEICHVAVQSKCEIVSHIRFTHPQSELECYCGQILRSKVDLARHKGDHRDSHVCQFCGDALPTKIKLKMHILSLHRKILALSCGICLRLFETQHVLRAHVQHAHIDQLRPLTSCTVCGKNYGSKWKTYDHLNKSHGRIFRACKVCLDVFDNEKELQIHFEKTHLKSNNIKQQQSHNNDNKKKPPENTQNESDYEQHDEPEEFDDDLTSNMLFITSSSSCSKQQPNGISNNNSKVSLLEKRLLLEKKPEQEHNKTTNKNVDTTLLPNNNNNDDIMQNSSKRTVYVNSNDPSLCEICLKVWPAKKHLWQHYIRCHKQTAATVCGICLKTNASYGALQRHLRDTHPRLLHGCGFGSNFICKICGRYHNASSKLRLHMAIHVGYSGDAADDDDDNYNMFDDNDEQNIPIDNKETPGFNNTDVVVVKQEIVSPTIPTNPEQNKDHNNTDEDDDDDDEGDDEEEDHSDVENHKNVYKENPEEQDEKMMQDSDEDDDSEENLASEESGSTNKNDDDEEQQHQQHQQQQQQQQKDDDNINYESLIEEVEASDDEEEEIDADEDDDDDDDDDEEEHNGNTTDEHVENVDDTTRTTENELEQEMLKNMIGESRSVKLTQIKIEEENHEFNVYEEQKGDTETGVVIDVDDDDDDDDDNDNDNDDDDDDYDDNDDDDEERILHDDITAYEVELINHNDLLNNCIEFVKNDDIKTEVDEDDDDHGYDDYDDDDDDDEDVDDNEQKHKTQEIVIINNELDSAIRSICDEDHLLETEVTLENTPGQEIYRRLVVTDGRVNESELETAVGSIL